LLSVPYSPEIAVGTVVKLCKVTDTSAHTAVFEKPSQLPSYQSGSLKVTKQANPSRRLPTAGRITALRNGSPASRLPKSRFSSSQGALSSPYGSRKRVQRLETDVKQHVKTVNGALGAVSANNSDFGSPQKLDDFTRRSKFYGVGPTIKRAKDAQRLIMGDRSV
jgi:hypothetical protein